MLPVTGRAREAGRRTNCQSNLRQLAVAVQQYVQDNDGLYPLAVYGTDKRDEHGLPVDLFWQHAIFGYIKTAQVFRCPTTSANSPYRVSLNAPDDLSAVDYLYNAARLNTWKANLAANKWGGNQESLIPNTATIWLNADQGWVNADGSYRYVRKVARTSCGRTFTGSTLHAGGGNYSFLDGHVKWLLPEAMGEVECVNGPLPPPFRD